MNLHFWKKQEIYGVTLSEPGSSSQVSGDFYPYVKPEVDFATCYEYYRTIGKVQNAVESYVSEILSRDWYFDGDKEAVRACEEWEERFNLSRIIEYIVRDWLVCGNSIIGTSDWQPVQVSSVVGVKRNPYGQAEQFVQLVNGSEVRLDASRFIHTQYIELNREAWGIGMFHSLLATFAYGKKRSLPHLEIYRRQIQLFYRILERYGSPVTVWFFENVARAEFDRQVEELRALEPGDRRILSKKVEIATETIDGRGNLINATAPVINQEIEAGLQTSANRLITQPSAMADARISEEKDSARLLGIMEKIRRMMNALVIPRITSGKVEFKWGKQDNFQFDFDQLLQAKSAGFVSADEGRAILRSVGWKLDDRLFNEHGQSQKGPSLLEPNPETIQEGNPYRDKTTGRFTFGPVSKNNQNDPSRNKTSPRLWQVRSNEERRKIDELARKHVENVQLVENGQSTTSGWNNVEVELADARIGEKHDAIEKSLQVLSSKELESLKGIKLENTEIISIVPDKSTEYTGVYLPLEGEAEIAEIDKSYGTDWKAGELVLALRGENDDLDEFHGVAVHELYHHKEDSMERSGDPAQIAAIQKFRKNFSEMDERARKDFLYAFGLYGIEDEHEGWSTIAQAYYVKPSADSMWAGRTKARGDAYLALMKKEHPRLSEIIDSWIAATNASNAG